MDDAVTHAGRLWHAGQPSPSWSLCATIEWDPDRPNINPKLEVDLVPPKPCSEVTISATTSSGGYGRLLTFPWQIHVPLVVRAVLQHPIHRAACAPLRVTKANELSQAAAALNRSLVLRLWA